MKIQEQHSPVPWRTSKAGDGVRERNLIIAADGHIIAEVLHSGIEWEEFEYNTKILSSAADFLDTLQQIARPDQERLKTSAFALQALAEAAIARLAERLLR